MTKTEIEEMIAKRPKTIRQKQYEYCLLVANAFKLQDGLHYDFITKTFPDGMCYGEWEATSGRFAAMILQVGRQGELQPSFAEYDTEEFLFRPSREMRHQLMFGWKSRREMQNSTRA